MRLTSRAFVFAASIVLSACQSAKDWEFGQNIIEIPANSEISSSTLDKLIEDGSLDGYESLIKVDDRLGKIIAVHVNSIMDFGYADELSARDFFHGHFMTASPKYCDMDKITFEAKYVNFEGIDKEEWLELFLASEPRFVYHTKEIGYFIPYRGKARSFIPYRGKARSIIAVNDNIFPMTMDTDRFIATGSVSGYEPFTYDGKHINGICYGVNNVKILINYENLHLDKIFLILKDGKGRYELKDGQKFDVFYEAVKNNRLKYRG